MKNEIAKTVGLTKFSQMLGILLDLVEEDGEKMGLAYGHPGIGKTTIAKYLAAQEGVYYWCALPGLSQSSFCAKLVDLVGGTPKKSFVQNLDFVIKSFQKNRTPLILDEADYLVSKELLSVVRTIHDQASIPIVLIGMTGVYQKISAQKLFLDRIQYFLEMTGINSEDTQMIINCRCEVLIAQDLAEQIYKQAKGNARILLRMLRQVERLALASGLTEINLEQWGDRPLVPPNSEVPTRRRSA